MKVGMMVRYCFQPSAGNTVGAAKPDADGKYEPQDVQAQVVRIHEDGGIDLAVLDGHHLVCGVSRPKRAATSTDRIKPGHWWPA